jgi:hypothetical protein
MLQRSPRALLTYAVLALFCSEAGFDGGVQAVCGLQADGNFGYIFGGECTPAGGGTTCAGTPDDPSVEWPTGTAVYK